MFTNSWEKVTYLLTHARSSVAVCNLSCANAHVYFVFAVVFQWKALEQSMANCARFLLFMGLENAGAIFKPSIICCVVKWGWKMILRHVASSCFNMKQFRSIWTNFGQISMILVQDLAQVLVPDQVRPGPSHVFDQVLTLFHAGGAWPTGHIPSSALALLPRVLVLKASPGVWPQVLDMFSTTKIHVKETCSWICSHMAWHALNY